MSDAWKQTERRVAKALGGVRLWRPDFSDSQPDGENDVEVWDTKCYQRHAAISLFLEAERKYKAFANGRRLLLVLFSRANNRQGDFVLIRMDDYLDLKRRAGE